MCGNNKYCSCGCSDSSLRGSMTKQSLTYGLGLTATAKRHLKPGHQYDKFFGPPTGETIDLGNGDQKKTLKVMANWVKKYKHQTYLIAKELKARNLINTLSNIWHFLYDHVQYKLDEEGIEQLYTPYRMWSDRAKGVDCDDFTTFISCCLYVLSIPHAFRMTKYDDDWQHVYIVVPKNGKKMGLQHRTDYFVVDPVADKFNYEHPFTQKHDLFMSNIPIQGLAGLGQTCDTSEKLIPKDYQLDYIPVQELERMGKVSTEQYLKENNIPYEVIRSDSEISLAAPINGKITKLPTVLDKEIADNLERYPTDLIADNKYTQPGEASDTDMTITANGENQKQSGIGSGWILAAIALGAGIWIMSETSPKKGGLGATPKNNKKPKARKRKKSPRKRSGKTKAITV